MNSIKLSRGGLLGLLAALIAVPFVFDAFHTEMVGKILIFSIFALSLNLLVGFTGLVSLGHAAYFGLAAYAVALLTANAESANLLWIMFLSVGASLVFAALVGLFVLRTKGIYFIMVTLAFAQMLFFVFHDTDIGGGSDGIYLGVTPSLTLLGSEVLSFRSGEQIYGLVLACLVLVYLFLNRLLDSRFGRAIQGIRSNEHRMQSMGYSTYWYKLGAFTLAGGLAGVAGFLYAMMFGFVTPELLSWHESGNVLLMVILGGIGNLFGSLLGATAFVLMQDLFSDLTDHWALLMGGVIVLAVLFLPGGLAKLPKTLLNRKSAGGSQ